METTDGAAGVSVSISPDIVVGGVKICGMPRVKDGAFWADRWALPGRLATTNRLKAEQVARGLDVFLRRGPK